MKLSLDYSTARYVINAYAEGAVTINEQAYHSSLIITPDSLHPDWDAGSVEDLAEQHIHTLIELQPEVILLGTGTELQFPQTRLMGLAMQKGIGFEVMDTGSACRTFNILSAEDRKVVAALIVS